MYIINRKNYFWTPHTSVFHFSTFLCLTLRGNREVKHATGYFVPWSFRSEYEKYFRSEPEICLIESFFHATKERMNSLSLERKDHGTK